MPTHGRSFIAKEEDSYSRGRCFVVTNDVSQMQGYVTDSGHESDNCFAAKPVFEQISDCDQMINKVHSIL